VGKNLTVLETDTPETGVEQRPRQSETPADFETDAVEPEVQ